MDRINMIKIVQSIDLNLEIKDELMTKLYEQNKDKYFN